MGQQRDSFAGAEARVSHSIAQTLVFDVLATIFTEVCCTEKSNDLNGPSGCTTLTLASVCQSWREVVFSLPILWSHFSMNLATVDKSLLDYHLERSGKADLSVIAEVKSTGTPVPASPPNNSSNNTEKAVLALAKHAYRLRHCTLRLTHFQSLTRGTLDPLFNADLQRINSLDITFGGVFGGGYSMAVQAPWLRLPPLLECLTLTAISIQPQTPLLHLRTLRLVQFSVSSISDYLRRCPEVLDVKIEACCCPFPPVTPCTSNLTSLHILTGVGTPMDPSELALFNALTLPSLTDLSIVSSSFMYDQESWSAALSEAVISMIERSGCRLLRLKLEYLSMQDADFVQLLDKVPDLQELIVYNSMHRNRMVTDASWRRLIPSSSDEYALLLPRLRVVRFLSTPELDHQSVVDFVTSRTDMSRIACTTFESLVMDRMTSEQVEELRQLFMASEVIRSQFTLNTDIRFHSSSKPYSFQVTHHDS